MVSQRGMKWVFQLDCHLGLNLTITLKRMVEFLTDVLHTFLYRGQHTHVLDHYSKLQWDLATIPSPFM
jgi:hypothetical protein